MKTKLYLKLFPIAIILFMQLEMRAQVTIGSEIEPNAGMLLDMKEYAPANDNTTATKGLVLPRVNLTDMSKLYPMFLGDTDYENNIGNKKNTEDAIHTGLTVYNTSVDLCTDIYPGVRVWDGTKWNQIGAGRFPAEIDILIDNRNPAKQEQYQIGKFGDAGWWMLENLRADRWPDGTTDGLIYGYPTGDMASGHLRYPKVQYYPSKGDSALVSRYGYMYSFLAAVRTMTYEELPEYSSQMRGVQGICPDGWHVPSAREWTALNKEIYLNPCKYAHSTINDNTGYNVQSMEDTPNGRSRTIKQGGFNANLLGFLSFPFGSGSDPNALILADVGQRAYFWLADTSEPGEEGTYPDEIRGYDWVATLDAEVNRMAQYPLEYIEQLNVRCVKDNTTKFSISNLNKKAEKVEKIERAETSDKTLPKMK